MLEQNQHFGTAVLAFITANSADRHQTEAAFKIEPSIPPGTTAWASPLVKSKSNCAACHSDAEQGSFEDAAMQLPRPLLCAAGATDLKACEKSPAGMTNISNSICPA
ncbi:MAG: diheme cytochrome c [Gammaproteobacteria bacterium]|uniref:hypothetical protein n=1 Tax=Rhodoferax sp. TaxID=50421 RepID=UPI00181BBC3F|nr:hypothetical protein [Rhodoferax sp.]MBU3898417.1 diheme cytochrome c [Gammaproteobacteria bacterium]MBU3998136.1 diheme cytochrome c [Gammaproteobacteria bacterium]MBU4079191.1 diheme cytochrome c [Gammaproteobacteria bacterium]MBU4115336.1 diheme cytochrome c [Gammaproteobacteria bacterium]